MKKEMICIICPKGCRLIAVEDGENLSVCGNSCPRGEQYAISEMRDPRRILTSTVLVKGGRLAVVPVVTSKGIHKEKLRDAMEIIAHAEVEAPVQMGDIIVRNIVDSGADLLVACDVERRAEL